MNGTVTLSPMGIATKTAKAGTIAMSGASQKRNLSALAGIISSLSMSLMASATGCNRPCGPTLQGPSLTCICPAIFLSIHVSGIGRIKRILVAIKTLIAIAMTVNMVAVSGIFFPILLIRTL